MYGAPLKRSAVSLWCSTLTGLDVQVCGFEGQIAASDWTHYVKVGQFEAMFDKNIQTSTSLGLNIIFAAHASLMNETTGMYWCTYRVSQMTCLDFSESNVWGGASLEKLDMENLKMFQTSELGVSILLIRWVSGWYLRDEISSLVYTLFELLTLFFKNKLKNKVSSEATPNFVEVISPVIPACNGSYNLLLTSWYSYIVASFSYFELVTFSETVWSRRQ